MKSTKKHYVVKAEDTELFVQEEISTMTPYELAPYDTITTWSSASKQEAINVRDLFAYKLGRAMVVVKL